MLETKLILHAVVSGLGNYGLCPRLLVLKKKKCKMKLGNVFMWLIRVCLTSVK
ncbi:unnamed protein product [Arabidopsis halleri]